MRKVYLLLALLAPCCLLAQQNLKDIRKKSYEAMVYRISAADAELFIHTDSIPVDRFANQAPDYVMPVESFYEDSLPKGHYVVISVNETDVMANLVGVTDMILVPVNNTVDNQFYIRKRDSGLVAHAKVWVNGKAARYDEVGKIYHMRQHKLNAGLVKIYAENDTAFVSVEATGENLPPLCKQHWKSFKTTRVGQWLTWLPSKAVGWLSTNNRRHLQPAEGSGYMLLNQPLFKLTDTVKMKAYVVNRHWKQYNKAVKVYLQYAAKGRSVEQLLGTVSPVSPGSFVYAFPLNDSLELNTRYRLVLKTAKDKRLIEKYFTTDDYLLDEVASYRFSSQQDDYHRNDTMHFVAAAKDANGLALLDARATLVLTTANIEKFYKDSMLVPDTLYKEERKLAPDQDTKFSVWTGGFPDADIQVNATLTFKNSNNESHDETASVHYKPENRQFVAQSERDSIVVTLLVDGKPMAAKGMADISGPELNRKVQVSYPLKWKIDPLADLYRFVVVAGKDTLLATVDVNNNYVPVFSIISRQDTLGFEIQNPYRVPISYSVLFGNHTIASGMDNQDVIKWTSVMRSKNKMLNVKWQYMWAGEHRHYDNNIALLFKLLKVDIQAPESIFPGQKDSISIEVKDYKGKPAAHVNLAAVAYNSQFKKDILVKEPPYLVKYRFRPAIVRSGQETDDAYNLYRYPLGRHRAWLQVMKLDTMPFYKMLFPKMFPYDVLTRLDGLVPQVSIHAVKNGIPQNIYLLSLNKQLVYYNGATEDMNYAFAVMPGYCQVSMRLKNKNITIDSIYIQPSYKHDIVIDLDSLPPHTVVTAAPAVWTNTERSLINSSMWQLEQNYGTDYGYIWQNQSLVRLNGNKRHMVGPFLSMDSLHFFAPGYFDLHFLFEPGCRYRLSPQIARLERMDVLPPTLETIKLADYKTKTWTLGDTLIPPPNIIYAKKKAEPFITLTSYSFFYNRQSNPAKLKLSVPVDTMLRYVILYSEDTSMPTIVRDGTIREIGNIRAGVYQLLLVNRDFKTAQVGNLLMQENATLCVNTARYTYSVTNAVVDTLISQSRRPIVLMQNNPSSTVALPEPDWPSGSAAISGVVMDKVGKAPVAGAVVSLKGFKGATVTAMNGTFTISTIAARRYKVVVSAVGYAAKEIEIDLTKNNQLRLDVNLHLSESRLDEVVVVGYGVSKKNSITGSVASISQELSALQGSVAGVAVGTPGGTYQIRIRGIAGVSGEAAPIYVVDGILYDKLPASIKPEMLQNVEVLQGAAAIALYGTRAANGVIVIDTGTKSLRTQFKDYAIWEPELFTSHDGKVSFAVTFPDNITGWEMYVLAMDKKRHMGKGVSFIKSFKPLVAQLNTPQFLLRGDTVELVSKQLNYTKDNYKVKAAFTANGVSLYTTDTILPPVASVIVAQRIVAGSDTVQAAFNLKTTTGFSDGEERKIPVFPQGLDEAKGAFFILDADTSITFTPQAGMGKIKLYTQNNTLDLLLNELNHLKSYPYYCMEQTASKLKGLLMERKVKQALGQRFDEDKTISMLQKKLQDNQLFDGGWSWWGKGQANLQITAYVLNTLLLLRPDPLIETNIRSGLLYLQNRLAHTSKEDVLQILSVMSQANHLIDYSAYLQKINFDSLTINQQWQWVKIARQQHYECSTQLWQLVAKSTASVTGGLHWGSENYSWYDNGIATTLLAYSVLEKEPAHQQALPRIIQYLLTGKSSGYWRNTVEASSIIATILPRVLQANKSAAQPTAISVRSDTSFTLHTFPAATDFNDTSAITVTKTGGGLTYLTLYQNWRNENPQPKSGDFVVRSGFEKNGRSIHNLPAGEKVTMVVNVNMLKDAEYVMIEIPIPAGCNYATKRQDEWGMHKEFYKDRLVLFSERLTRGTHRFEVELETRYKGSFTLNPASVRLMYFPTFSANNEVNRVTID